MAGTPDSIEEARIDLWLWAVRLFKTRSLAAGACRGGKVRINGHHAKPARNVRPGDRLEVRKADLTRTVVVRQVLTKRVGAKVVEEYLEDLTPPEVYQAAADRRIAIAGARAVRGEGTGRPTKRDRRKWSKAAEQAAEREEAVTELMRKSLEQGE